MSDKFFKLNWLLFVLDFLVCTVSVIGFLWGAAYFNHWWISLFDLIPLALYTSHGILCDPETDKEEQKGDEQK